MCFIARAEISYSITRFSKAFFIEGGKGQNMSKEEREQIQNALKKVNISEFIIQCLNKINEGVRGIEMETSQDKVQLLGDTILFLKSLEKMGLKVNTHLHKRLGGILSAQGVVEEND